ncbi:fibronectin type III domain-containing protein [Anaerovorax odorimutans]|uniref:Fibronectin type III domain-containing protein n=1 Tax=Anaerovorax odorimutans TaxID=109327 RepID=A0ABT1RJN5_9FIRM|nr:fibronectin type III domain-containing protein [Anaerovorax odorimutans]MCQ4635394.1 fibronectin type III domain-containing protein [Anaerovorax odorimutans]
MRKKQLLAIVLSIIMVLSCPISAFATDGASSGGSGPTAVEKAAAEEIDASVWVAKDFTYTDYEKLLYGCDYARQITIKGTAISGFSETGEKKLEKNKDLVLPAVDDKGTAVVGVAENAFYDKGLTSVKFPTGMMISYDDTVTHRVTKRGNFVIAENAFAKNELTSVNLPEGVIACLSSAFNNNKITTVKLPKTIWWLETMSFASNRITTVNFPTTCDFQLEMHGMAFAKNFIKSVRLPDFTEVVNKDTFVWNTGKEALAADAKAAYKTYTVEDKTYDAGVVYMYADNAELELKDRIHHTGKSTASQQSDVQKLVINEGTGETQNPDLPWNINDFNVEGTVVKGLSASGEAKRATNKNLVIPDINKDGQYITEIAAAEGSGNGLFGSADEGFDTVNLPNELTKIGDFAFQKCGISEVSFPARLEKIGIAAFQTNNLTSVILPDTVTTLGSGAFATNPKLERISISNGLTEIPASAFGCSDAKNWMEGLTSIQIPEGITAIGSRAFAGNNFHEITIPASVKTIGTYAFSTKNYLKDPCVVTLNEGLETIGADAFRNKCISDIGIPKTVTKIDKNTFRKEYSDSTEAIVTKVYVSLKSQYEDRTNFPASDYHKLYLTDTSEWTAEDFLYQEQSFTLWPADEYQSTPNFTAWVVKGLSESGEKKLESNKNLVIPEKDPDGKTVQGIGDSAFSKKGVTSLTLPEGVKTDYDDSTWETTGKGLTKRGDFFIGANAFQGNALTTLDLPDGVIYVGSNAFKNNQLTAVNLPKSLMMIGNGSFAANSISSLMFPEQTDFNLQIDSMAFAINKITSVRIPSNTEKLIGTVFLKNTGMEPVTSGTSAAEKESGIVYMYKAQEGGGLIEHVDAGNSKVQKLIIGSIPNDQAPWNEKDFTYDQEGTAITGLSEEGQSKIKKNAALILPKQGPEGKTITALGDGTNAKGIFVYTEGDTNYAPESIILPSTLEKIGNSAFALNPSAGYEKEMTAVVFPKGLKEIGQTAFQNAKLTSIVIPDSVTTMGSEAFTGCGALTEVKLSKNMEAIPDAAFDAGTSKTIKLKNLEIPDGVKTIGKNAFSGTHVEKLALPKTLTAIGNYAFQNHQLTDLDIPESVKTIGKYAFKITEEGLTNGLTSVTMHEGLETIGQEAFMGNKLTSIDLPGTVILSHANKPADCIFGNAKTPASPIVQLKTSNKTQVEEGNTEFANSYSHKVVYDKLIGTGWTANDFTYDEESGTITGWSDSGNAARAGVKALVLPDQTPSGKDIVAIGDEAFKIPDDEVTVTKFGIESPGGMTSVNLPANLKKIGKSSFAQNALDTVDLTGLTSIGESAFYGNQLAKAEIPDTVVDLGNGAFSNNNITKLKLSAGVTKIPQGAFSMNIRLEQVTIPNTVTEIGATAFAGARLTSLNIPSSVEKIGEKAFHLHHLTTLTIPGNVKEIGASAFEGTYKATTLAKLTIGEGVSTIGKYAFKEALLETVHFPNSVQTVGEQPFLNNKGKNGSHVVEVTTNNIAHTKLKDDTYKVKYLGAHTIKSSSAAVWEKGNAGLTFQTNALTEQLEKVVVNGKTLSKGTDYVVEKGEYLRIALKPGYLESLAYTLNAKTFNVEIVSTFGTAKASFTVKPTIRTVSLSKAAYAYNGKVKKPSVMVKDNRGQAISRSNYTVTYAKGRKNVGTYKVTVKFNGRPYSGTVSRTFKINPKATSVKLKKGKKQFTAKWKKVSKQATGYQIQYSTSKKFKSKTRTITVKGYKKTSKTIKKLKKNRRYYVKVRTYKKVGKTKYYSSWSKVRSIKTK